MKLQAASQKELKNVSLGVAICDIAMVAGLFLLSLVGVGKFQLFRVLLGTLCGSLVGIFNFAILCITVQEAVEIQNKNKMRRRFQRSYNLRLLIQAGWVVLCFLIPQVHFVAGAAPILFPNLVIFYRETHKKPVPAAKRTSTLEDEGEGTLETFEI